MPVSSGFKCVKGSSSPETRCLEKRGTLATVESMIVPEGRVSIGILFSWVLGVLQSIGQSLGASLGPAARHRRADHRD